MDVAARFCDARLKSGGASASALALASTLAPSLVHRSLSRVRPRAGGVDAWALGCSAVGQHSRHSQIPSGGCYWNILCGLSITGLWP
jgi:hypothetical protein